jgi:hypothetical protein
MDVTMTQIKRDRCFSEPIRRDAPHRSDWRKLSNLLVQPGAKAAAFAPRQ